MANDVKKIDAVFEGGGVKGIGLVGAVAVTQEKGYQFSNVAGTSAGAIVASLVAAGYTAAELKQILDALDYTEFKDPTRLDRIPLVGKVLSVSFDQGVYLGRFFERWLRDLLAKKNIRVFRDLVMPEYKDDPRYRYKTASHASDITRGKLLVLPSNIADYGLDPDELEVARAVRMSMSITYLFEPVVLHAAGAPCYIVDGGVLSNYPIWLFDDGNDPPWPTLGYKLVDPQEGRPHKICGPLTLFEALFATMMEAHDARYIQDHDFVRSIPIPTLGVRTTDFELSKEQAEALYRSGVEAARKFFERWDFERYKATYRRVTPLHRTERLAR